MFDLHDILVGATLSTSTSTSSTMSSNLNDWRWPFEGGMFDTTIFSRKSTTNAGQYFLASVDWTTSLELSFVCIKYSTLLPWRRTADWKWKKFIEILYEYKRIYKQTPLTQNLEHSGFFKIIDWVLAVHFFYINPAVFFAVETFPF